MITMTPYTVNEAEVAVFHAWGDGMRVNGPIARHLFPPALESFRTGLKMTQVGELGANEGFGDWRLHGSRQVMSGDWLVEFSSPFGSFSDGLVQLSSILRPGSPVVIVVRFLCQDTGNWRVFQFHDAAAEPTSIEDERQLMNRGLKFSAGWMEEFKSGTMPSMEPRVFGVIEWRHLGRSIRCWEYNPQSDTWTEDAENSQVVDEETVRYVSMSEDAGTTALSYIAARTAGSPAVGIEWVDALVFQVNAPSGLTLEPGWALETGCAEPLRLPASGRNWEHPRVVLRVLGRIYATIEAGVIAVPSYTSDVTVSPIDIPIRIGELTFYPEGAWAEV